MSFDNHRNFASSTVAVAPSPATSGTSVTVAVGDGAKFPAAPFNATIWPAGQQPTSSNAEIVRVTAKSTDTFTITRTQESTSARSIVSGDQIAATITAKTITDVESAASGASPLTTKGDLFGYDTANARIPVGANGKALVADSTQSLGVGYAYPPGYEFDYVEMTSNVTVTATTDGNSNGTALIDGNAVTYDGSTRIKIECWFHALEINEPNVGRINLYDGTTDLGRMILTGIGAGTATTDFTLYGVRFLTPPSGSHTYHIRGWKTAGTFTVYGGAGGASTILPAWYRITKA